MAELGLMGIAVPEAYGGSGSDTVAYAWRSRRSPGRAPPTR